MSLDECFDKTTPRQYAMWMIWFEKEMNRPDRHDYYQMQTAKAASQSKAKLDAFKIPFEFEPRVLTRNPNMTKQEAAAMAKAKWFAITGYKRKT